MPNTPNINIATGEVTPTGGLQKGHSFYWYNPNVNDVAITINDCGTWCEDSQYTIPANQQYVEGKIQSSPNENPYAWTENPNAWSGSGGPHIGPSNPGQGTPIVSIQTGVVTGSLQAGQAFNWNNPNPGTVTINNCGPWCAASSYSVTGSGLTPAAMARVPNASICAWTESPNRWTAPGMPHAGNPPWPVAADEKQKHKEVA